MSSKLTLLMPFLEIKSKALSARLTGISAVAALAGGMAFLSDPVLPTLP